MAINSAVSTYGTNEPDQMAAVVDVDINTPNVNRPERTSAKALAVYLAGTAAGAGGDATAANQALQITQETAINTVLGTVTASPVANTIGDRLKIINTTLGTPLQAGGVIGALPAGSAIIGNVRIDQTTPGTTNGVVATGNIAHDGVDSGNPIKIGGYASSTAPTAVAAGDRVNAWYGLSGSVAAFFTDNAGNTLGTGSPTSDGVAAAGGLVTRTQNLSFNGTTWDRLVKANATSRIISSAASTNATSAKASAGNVFMATGRNTNAAVLYLKLYNKASAPTVGTDTPVQTFALPPQANFALDWPTGRYFATGIAYAFTTGGADADTGAVAAGDILGFNLDYS